MELVGRVRDEVARVVVGVEEEVELLLCAAAVGGHVLLDGVPGVAKTLTATAVSRALGLETRRVQFTPDMLPSDVTGTVGLRGGEPTFRPGPVFCQLLVADEINRTPPKTQAALLEAMQERHVTVDGTRHPLPEPFLVVATRNPIDQEGTYPLPEAQLDRFLLQLRMEYPSEEAERELVLAPRRDLRPASLDDVRPVGGPADVRAMGEAAAAVHVHPDVAGYAVAVVRATRRLPSVSLGGSPRAGVHLVAAAQASAALDGRDYVRPDDVRRLAGPVLAHRLLLTAEAQIQRFGAGDAVAAALDAVPVPA